MTVRRIANRFAEFGKRVLAIHREDFNDVDGGTLQDIAEECGLLERITVTKPCGENCECAQYGDFPQECLRLRKGVKL